MFDVCAFGQIRSSPRRVRVKLSPRIWIAIVDMKKTHLKQRRSQHRRRGTNGALRYPGSLRHMLVFSLGHCTQRRINSRGLRRSALIVSGSSPDQSSSDEHAQLQTESEPSLRLLALSTVARFLFTFRFSPIPRKTVATPWESRPSRPPVGCSQAAPATIFRLPDQTH